MDISARLLYNPVKMPAESFVLLHARHQPKCHARVDKEFYGYCSLQMITEGAAELFYGTATRHLLTPTTLWPAYPGVRIRFHPAQGFATWEHRHVAFCGSVVLEWAASGLWPPPPQSVPPAASSEYVGLFDGLLGDAARAGGDRLARLAVKNRLETLLILLAQARRGGVEEAEWLQTVQAALDPETHFAPDYETIARGCHMSLSKLRRRFHAATGCSLHDYFLRGRITRACALLHETDLPVKAVAERLGYTDVFFFTRQFRRVVGVPPATYRRSL